MGKRGNVVLENTTEGHNKYWKAKIDDKNVDVNWGKIGTTGQFQQKNFKEGEEAYNFYMKMIRSKIKKGYVLKRVNE